MGWEININRCPPIVYNTSTVVFMVTAKPEPSRQKQNTSWQKQNTSRQKQNTSRQKQKLTARGKTRGKSKYMYCTRAWRREAWNPRFSQRMLGLGANPAWRHSMSDIHPKSRIIKPSKKLLVLMSSGKREGNICLILVEEVIRKEILNNTYNKH